MRTSLQDNSLSISFKTEPFFLIIYCLILMNFYNASVYISYSLVPFAILAFKKNPHLFDYTIFFIFLFSFLYSLVLLVKGSDRSLPLVLGYFFFPPVFYFLGKLYISKYPSTTTVYYLLFFTCLLFSILPFISNLLSFFENGFMQNRNIRMFWMQGDTAKAATQVGSYFAFSMAMLPLIFIKNAWAEERTLSFLALVLFLTALFSILNMSNRTGLLIMVVGFLVFIIIPKENRFWHSLLAAGFLLLVGILYETDTLSIKSWFEYSKLHDRITGTSVDEEGSRIVIWKANLTNLIHYPFGYASLHSLSSYAHNLWLDVGRATGIIPLIPLVVFTTTSIYKYGKFIFSLKFGAFLRFIIAAFGTAFFITFSLEPIMEGYFIMFLLYCFYFGILTGCDKYLNIYPRSSNISQSI